MGSEPVACPKGHKPTLHKSTNAGLEWGFACPCDTTVGLYRSEAEALAAWNTPKIAEADKYRIMLLDLLAVIHRDGGHKTQEIGIKLAWEQAMQLSSERIAKSCEVYELTREIVDAAPDCPSCGGMNTSCPEGCGRDPVTGELNGTRLDAAPDGLVERLLEQVPQGTPLNVCHLLDEAAARITADAAALAERDELLKRAHNELREGIQTMREAEAALAERDATIAALKAAGDKLAGFAGHEFVCDVEDGAWSDPMPPCTCGYTEAWKVWRTVDGVAASATSKEAG